MLKQPTTSCWKAGEPCVECGSSLEVVRCIEAGRLFKLGTKHSDAFGAFVLDPDGGQKPLVMGSYGIGIGRNVAQPWRRFHTTTGAWCGR